MYPAAGISGHENDGRALISTILDDAAAGIELEGQDLRALARGFEIVRKKS